MPPPGLPCSNESGVTTARTGDRTRAERWFQKYEAMPEALRAALDQTKDIPVDIDPRGSFPEGVK